MVTDNFKLENPADNTLQLRAALYYSYVKCKYSVSVTKPLPQVLLDLTMTLRKKVNIPGTAVFTIMKLQ